MNDMKIAMIAPQLVGEIASEELGLCSIASLLREKGYNVKVIAVTNGKKDYKEILDFNPNVIGVTVYNQTVELAYEICEDLKKKLPNSYICVGGYAPTYHAEEILKEAKFIDFAIRGEGEFSFLELVNNLGQGKSINNVKGLAYRNEKDDVILNERHDYIEDLDILPFGSRELLLQDGLTLVCSTRGCVRNCFFCCGNDFWKKDGKYNWRARSISNFVDEIEYLNKELNRKQFWIVDATFEDPGFNEERIRAFAEEVIKRGLVISYFVFLRSTFQRKASDDLMELLVKSGLCEVFVGAEAANDYDLKVLGKGITVEDNIKSIKLFEKYDVYPEIGFINFNPYSTFEGLRKNAEFLREYKYSKFFRQISTVKIYKGSRLYQKLQEDGLLKESKFYEEEGYEYVDKRVGTLAKFLEEYFNYLQRESNLIGELFGFERYYGTKIAHMKRHLKVERKGDAFKLLVEYKNRLDEILYDLNTKVSDWYEHLLDLAEYNWEYDRAMKISKEMLNKDYISNVFMKLRMERIKFGKGLAKLDLELMSLIRVS